MPGKRIGRMLLAKSLLMTPQRNFRYTDFHSFHALAANQPLTCKMVLAYQAIFGDPDGWAEHYTSEEVLQMFERLNTED